MCNGRLLHNENSFFGQFLCLNSLKADWHAGYIVQRYLVKACLVSTQRTFVEHTRIGEKWECKAQIWGGAMQTFFFLLKMSLLFFMICLLSLRHWKFLCINKDSWIAFLHIALDVQTCRKPEWGRPKDKIEKRMRAKWIWTRYMNVVFYTFGFGKIWFVVSLRCFSCRQQIQICSTSKYQGAVPKWGNSKSKIYCCNFEASEIWGMASSWI